MKKEKKKLVVKSINNDKVVVEREGSKTYFEIVDNNNILHTYDVGEGVSALIMCENDIDDSIWNLRLTADDKKEINSVRALYWLTGGNREWVELCNYNLEWSEASILFKKKFGGKITRIIRKSTTLRDIKEKFEHNFNMTILYEFAIKNDLIND